MGLHVIDHELATSNVATVTINVTPVNDAPITVNDSRIVLEGATTTRPDLPQHCPTLPRSATRSRPLQVLG